MDVRSAGVPELRTVSPPTVSFVFLAACTVSVLDCATFRRGRLRVSINCACAAETCHRPRSTKECITASHATLSESSFRACAL